MSSAGLDRSRPTQRPDTAGRRGTSGGAGRFDTLKAGAFLLVILVVFIVLEALLPLSTAVKIGADEDFELSKATLVMKGYKLYTEIWNDQPPLNTSLLIAVIKHVSPAILGPRLVSAGFALVLLSSFFLLVWRLSGVFVACLATAMVLGSPGFIELSSSCMQEIPALAPALAALSILVLVGSSSPFRASAVRWFGFAVAPVVAGLLFGFALQLKLIGIIYAPLAVLIIWMQHRKEQKAIRSTVLASAGFGAIALLAFIGLNYLTSNPLLLQLQQSWSAHFSSAKSFEYGSPADRPFDWTVLLKNWDTTLPALFGAGFLARRLVAAARRQSASNSSATFNHQLSNWQLPLVWLTLTFVVFAAHISRKPQSL